MTFQSARFFSGLVLGNHGTLDVALVVMGGSRSNLYAPKPSLFHRQDRCLLVEVETGSPPLTTAPNPTIYSMQHPTTTLLLVLVLVIEHVKATAAPHVYPQPPHK